MREYKVVSIIFKDGKPDLATMEELIPLVVISREDIESRLGRISDIQFEMIRDKAFDLEVPDAGVLEWFDSEVCKAVKDDLEKETPPELAITIKPNGDITLGCDEFFKKIKYCNECEWENYCADLSSKIGEILPSISNK